MNKVIYYLSVFLFFAGLSIIIGKNMVDFKFLLSSIIVYIYTGNLFKRINNKFVINFDIFISILLIILTSVLLIKYRQNISFYTVAITTVIYIIVIVSQKLIFSKLN